MIDEYAKFVDHTTSTESKDYVAFVDRLWALEDKANLPRLLTAVIGMQSETGEFADEIEDKPDVYHDLAEDLSEGSDDEPFDKILQEPPAPPTRRAEWPLGRQSSCS